MLVNRLVTEYLNINGVSHFAGREKTLGEMEHGQQQGYHCLDFWLQISTEHRETVAFHFLCFKEPPLSHLRI